MMAYLIPETITRLQATTFVHNAEISNIGRSGIIREAAKNLAEQALRKLLDDCITTGSYMGHQGQTLRLDVFVISPAELDKMLAQARASGDRDAMRWIAP